MVEKFRRIEIKFKSVGVTREIYLAPFFFSYRGKKESLERSTKEIWLSILLKVAN